MKPSDVAETEAFMYSQLRDELKQEPKMNDLTKRNQDLPAHLGQYNKAKIGNVDSTDRIIPRIKLIQAISPELQDFPDAKAGQFWHTVAQENLGPSLKAIPIIIRKSFVLWAPRNDDRGILARAADGVHWDLVDVEFTVKPKGSPNNITYKTAKTVAESGLDQFGSSIPGDANSPPAASLTYNMMWYLPDYPELSPSIIINTRSSVKPMQQLLSKIDSKPVAHFVQVYDIGSTQQKGAEGPYFNFTYTGAGFANAEDAKICEAMYEQFSKGGWVASDESEEELDTKPAGKVDEEMAASGKF
jgi:hypothetical protein